MYYVYVLRSEKDHSFYKGYTKNLEERLKQHNQGKSKYTSTRRPWELIYYEEFPTEQGAVAREKYFKTSAGRRFLKRNFSCYMDLRASDYGSEGWGVPVRTEFSGRRLLPGSQ